MSGIFLCDELKKKIKEEGFMAQLQKKLKLLLHESPRSFAVKISICWSPEDDGQLC